MRIYTKTGDGGTTSLVGGKRVGKNHPRVEAYGSVDELTAHLAYLRDNMEDIDTQQEYRNDLLQILNDLMTVAAGFACEDEHLSRLPVLSEEDIRFLEQRIDVLQAEVPPADKFTLPGGHPLVSLAHIARTVCRRAERNATRIECEAEAYRIALQYLNRLSDYLYILGRKISQDFNIPETFWVPKK